MFDSPAKQLGELQRSIKKITQEIEEVEGSRPAAALRSERGDSVSLNELDTRVAKLRLRKSTLEDAVIAAKHELRRVKRGAIGPLMMAIIKQGERYERAFQALLECQRERVRLVQQAQAKAQELGLRLPGMSDVLENLVRRIAREGGYKRVTDMLTLPYVESAATIPQEDEALVGELAAMAEADNRPARRPKRVKPEDLPTGVLGAMNAAARAAIKGA